MAPFLYVYRATRGDLVFGAVVKHFTAAFYTALRSVRVFVLDDAYEFRRAERCCDGEHFECFFLPLLDARPVKFDGGRKQVIGVN